VSQLLSAAICTDGAFAATAACAGQASPSPPTGSAGAVAAIAGAVSVAAAGIRQALHLLPPAQLVLLILQLLVLDPHEVPGRESMTSFPCANILLLSHMCYKC